MRFSSGCSRPCHVPTVYGRSWSGCRATTTSPWLIACNNVTPPKSTAATMLKRIVMPRSAMKLSLLSAWKLTQQPMTHEHQDKGSHKNHPARKLVKKTFGHFVPEMICQQAGSHDPNCIAYDGDGYHQEREHPAHPAPVIHQVTVRDRKRDQCHERPDPAARVNNLQRIIRKDDQITFAQYGHVHRL